MLMMLSCFGPCFDVWNTSDGSNMWFGLNLYLYLNPYNLYRCFTLVYLLYHNSKLAKKLYRYTFFVITNRLVFLGGLDLAYACSPCQLKGYRHKICWWCRHVFLSMMQDHCRFWPVLMYDMHERKFHCPSEPDLLLADWVYGRLTSGWNISDCDSVFGHISIGV